MSVRSWHGARGGNTFSLCFSDIKKSINYVTNQMELDSFVFVVFFCLFVSNPVKMSKKHDSCFINSTSDFCSLEL